jgi:hypothetical protein
MAGLDPASSALRKSVAKEMDHRVEPGEDESMCAESVWGVSVQGEPISEYTYSASWPASYSASWPDLIRPSSALRKSLAKKMDHRVKPGDDVWGELRLITHILRHGRT